MAMASLQFIPAILVVGIAVITNPALAISIVLPLAISSM